MTDRRAVGVLRQVGDVARASAPDAALLAWFAAEWDEAAFAELVRRHGPTVLGVCRRVARHPQDAEDAFQAVFLVLATKAGTLTRPEMLGNWLYGVAYRVARRARRSAARRRAREGQVVTMPEPVTQTPEPAADLAAVIDDALAELPERFRAAVLLCDLHGLPRSEAATRLGIPEGTLSSRLATGRKRLADRLARRGVTAPAAGLAAVLGGPATAVPPGLATRAAAAAVAWVSGGVVPAVLRQLATEGGLTMSRAIVWATAACAAMGLVVGAVAAWPGDDPKKPAPPTREKAGADKLVANPVDDRPKPAATRRVRLVKTFDLSGQPGTVQWSTDGSLLAAEVGDRVCVIDAKKLEILAKMNIGTTEFVSGEFLRFVPGKPTLVTRSGWTGRINEQPQLRFWGIPPTVDQAAQLVRTTELDEENGVPLWFLPDGDSILCSRRLPEGATVYQLVSTGTGESIREVARVSGEKVVGGLSPDGKVLVVVASKTIGVAIESWDVATGKRAWARDLEAERMRREFHVPHPVIVSPDSKTVAITFDQRLGAPPKAGPRRTAVLLGEIRLFDMMTGEDRAPLEDQAVLHNLAYSFSHDGRLFIGNTGVGSTEESRRERRLVIWDTGTGKVVRSWNGSAEACFAPDRPVLAILESVGEVGPDGKSIAKSVLGFWDLSALAK